MTIRDSPGAASHRVSRHFMPIETIRRNIDGMAVVKMNVFHWHLSDDQGFRVEPGHPKLEQAGSDGKSTTPRKKSAGLSSTRTNAASGWYRNSTSPATLQAGW